MTKNKDGNYKLTMKNIPKDVMNFILDKQVEFKKQRLSGTALSLETTIIRLIQSHQEFKK